ncbi:MAG: MarR family transcriptional regulator [Chloroflexi bacterium]|nr:MarR family transcriptional regulator [Chloroflexota bacterium]
MENELLDSVVEDLFRVLPIVHRRLLRFGFEAIGTDISRHHFVVMKMLDDLGPQHVSAVGSRLMISRPQMTHVAGKMVRLGLIERQPDPSDRRVTILRLTDHGRLVLVQCREMIRDSVKEHLATLDKQDLEEFSALLKKLADIGSKLQPSAFEERSE